MKIKTGKSGQTAETPAIIILSPPQQVQRYSAQRASMAISDLQKADFAVGAAGTLLFF